VPRYGQTAPPDYRQAAPVNYGPPPARSNYGKPAGSGGYGAYQASYPPRTPDRGPPGGNANYAGNPIGTNGPPRRYNYHDSRIAG
jgi:hypothetical protein